LAVIINVVCLHHNGMSDIKYVATCLKVAMLEWQLGAANSIARSLS